ncbi:hypothetical protein SZN_05487 [Streptomyces zinciresistens K42]|uniref:Uncharacterized protein n=1 Tax=Streptomyces zinciresistens K42 TaxID=700597 RepID=G2G6J0_9ACTN|nr:hypothetical protein SZN_05487 [Streptomyces zinciresistens K42]
MHQLIAGPFLDEYLVLRPGRDAAMRFPLIDEPLRSVAADARRSAEFEVSTRS